MPSHRQDKRIALASPKVVFVAFASAAVMFLLHACGAFLSLDHWFYDRFAQLQSHFSFASPHTLVIRSDRNLSEDELRRVAEACRKKGAGLIVFVDDREPLRAFASRFPMVDTLSGTEQPPPADGIERGFENDHPLVEILERHYEVTPPPGPHRFDFRVTRKGVPTIQLQRALAGDIPSDLIEGKLVFVGRDGPKDRRILTSVDRGTDALSPVYLQAIVADSLLRNGLVALIPERFSWGIGLLGGLALGLWLKIRNYRGSISFYLSLGVLIFLATESLLIFKGQWVTPVGLVVPIITVIGAGSRMGGIMERDSLKETLRSLAVETRGRARKTVDCSPWMMVEQAFSAAFSCEGFALAHTNDATLVPVSDLGRERIGKWFTEAELRPKAEPFSSALRDGHTSIGDHLVIVPIRTPARLVGFWIFESTETRTVAEAKRYADRMALYLEQRKKNGHHGIVAGPSAPLHNQLSSAIDSLEDRRKLLAGALNCSGEAVLIFDSLGGPEYVSQHSLELFANAGIEIKEMRPLELITQLTKVGEKEIQWGLRFVALHRKEVTLQAREDLIPGRCFFLHLRPLEHPASDEASLPGLVVLIEDITDIANGLLVKDDFMERFHFQLNNDFEVIVSAASLMIDQRVSSNEQGELLNIITEKVREASDLFSETREHLQSGLNPDFVERFPIGFTRVFEAAKGSIERIARERQVTIQETMSDYLPLVIGSPGALEDLLHSMLLTLIHNASENSVIHASVSVDEDTLTLTMKNRGFGMPEEQLRHLLETGAGGWDTLDRIGAARQSVTAWGGQLNVNSRVGEGIEFHLTLSTVL